jgi:uncharacterized protein (UPF0335 family)
MAVAPVEGSNSAAKLRSLVERLESMAHEIKALKGDEKGIYDEAKVAGFEPKQMRGLLKRRMLDPEQIQRNAELEEAIDRLENQLLGRSFEDKAA